MRPLLKSALTNAKVILRPLDAKDEPLLRPIAAEKELWEYGLSDLSLPGKLRRYIEKALQARGEGTCAVWTIIDRSSGNVAGCTRLGEISWDDERGQIGWTWIGKDFQGTGLNRAAKYEILRFGFEVLRLNRIELKADERNIRSRKAILNIGAIEEGTLRQHMKTHDGFLRNTVFYSILRSEWQHVKEEFFGDLDL
ncbi:GNAT family N-acetyltransferase [Arcticibacter tournemirensis]